jgi:pimeloyl-ACP methyl ester carboxylesterase
MRHYSRIAITLGVVLAFASPAHAEDAKGATRREIVPVIVVPGIMGTRLVDDGKMIWNPTGKPDGWVTSKALCLKLRCAGPRAAVYERLLQPTPLAPAAELQIPAGNGARSDYAERAKAIAGFAAFVPDYYDELLFQLQDPAFARTLSTALGRAVEPRVYAYGYDWRQDNAVSAAGLATLVARAKRETQADRVIIVAHSMGGLVSRYYAKRLGGESNLAALVLLGSPTHGSSQSYRFLKLGPDALQDFQLSFGVFTTTSKAALRKMVRRFASLYQLLPTDLFARLKPSWLTLPKKGITGSGVHNIYVDSAVGFLDADEDVAVVTANLRTRAAFHGALMTGASAYMPPRTYVLYSSGLPTDAAFSLVGAERAYTLRTDRAAGDGTVVLESARADGCQPTERIDLGYVQHGAMANHPATIAKVKEVIAKALVAARNDKRPAAASVRSRLVPRREEKGGVAAKVH